MKHSDRASVEAAISLLRTRGEGPEYEAKESRCELSNDVWETVSAFANTEGGTILLGVSEKDGFSPVPGFQIDKVEDQFVVGMGDGGQPGRLTSPPEYRLRRCMLEGLPVLLVEVDELPMSEKPCYITARGVLGGSYKRVDGKDVKLSANEVYSLQSASAVDGSDRRAVPEATADDLDREICLRAFERARTAAPRALRGAETEAERLRRLNFTDAEGGVTKAGLLTAGAYPQQFFPKLSVDVAVHPGMRKSTGGPVRFLDRQVCEGTVGEMIDEAVKAVERNLRTVSTVTGTGRIDEPEVPEAVLREAIANALVHRSYDRRFDGEGVAVDVFPDRVEITNPGGLWGKSREDLADGRSCCRNATLMRLLSLVPLPEGAGSPAEGNGSGIPLMVHEMSERGMEPPSFRPAIDHFKVVVPRPTLGRTAPTQAASAGTRKGRASIEATLKEHGELSLREIVDLTALTKSQARRRVNDLIAAGTVEPTAPPTSRKRKYRLAR